ncbi:hypothetical protein Tco_1127476 [Tanacetum coccineum]
MGLQEKGDVLDAEAKAFLADVECTAPYDQPQALTTTNMFQANHEDAYDSDVDEGPNVVVAFMANLSSTSATNSQLSQEMHQDEHLDSDAETKIDEAEIILSQGLPRHIFNILNQTSTAKEIWDNVELLMQGSEHGYLNHTICSELYFISKAMTTCQKDSQKQEQPTSIVDPLPMMLTTNRTCTFLTTTPSPQPTLMSPNDSFDGTMTQLLIFLSGLPKAVSTHQHQLRLLPTPKLMPTWHDGQICY